jgi:outer membrane immunogenic protein
MKVVRIALLATAALAATPALAQDESTFTGFYAGAIVGYDHVTITDGADSESKDGVVYGALLGYDYDLGSTVIGAEAEITGSSVKQTAEDLIVVGDDASIKAGRDLYVGLRVGFKATPRTLVYLKGGYTNARVSVQYDDHTGFAFNAADNLDGYRIGGGVEYSFGRIAVRGEYRYSGYGDYHYAGLNTDLSANRHQAVVTLVGKF